MVRPKVIVLNDERNAVSSPAASAEIGASLEDQFPLLFRAEAPRLSSVCGPLAKKSVLSTDEDWMSKLEVGETQL